MQLNPKIYEVITRTITTTLTTKHYHSSKSKTSMTSNIASGCLKSGLITSLSLTTPSVTRGEEEGSMSLTDQRCGHNQTQSPQYTVSRASFPPTRRHTAHPARVEGKMDLYLIHNKLNRDKDKIINILTLKILSSEKFVARKDFMQRVWNTRK